MLPSLRLAPRCTFNPSFTRRQNFRDVMPRNRDRQSTKVALRSPLQPLQETHAMLTCWQGRQHHRTAQQRRRQPSVWTRRPAGGGYRPHHWRSQLHHHWRSQKGCRCHSRCRCRCHCHCHWSWSWVGSRHYIAHVHVSRANQGVLARVCTRHTISTGILLTCQ